MPELIGPHDALDTLSSVSNVLCHFLPADDGVCLPYHGLHLVMNIGDSIVQTRGALLAFAQIVTKMVVGDSKLIVCYCFIVVFALALLVEDLDDES